MNDISVFGSTGYIGNTFCEKYPDKITRIDRNSKDFDTNQSLYFISTTTNQNVFKDIHIDIDTNLNLFVIFYLNVKIEISFLILSVPDLFMAMILLTIKNGIVVIQQDFILLQNELLNNF